MDNIMIAFELCHYMNRKSQGNKGVVALKTGISKAYGRIKWKFLQEMMAKFGFQERWIDLVMMC